MNPFAPGFFFDFSVRGLRLRVRELSSSYQLLAEGVDLAELYRRELPWLRCRARDGERAAEGLKPPPVVFALSNRQEGQKPPLLFSSPALRLGGDVEEPGVEALRVACSKNGNSKPGDKNDQVETAESVDDKENKASKENKPDAEVAERKEEAPEREGLFDKETPFDFD